MMKKIAIPVLLASLAFSFQALAKDPLDGVWRLDNVKSYWTDGKMPKGMSLTIRVNFESGTLDYYSINDTLPDKKSELRYHIPIDGKSHPLPDHGPDDRYNAVAVSRMGPREFQFLKLKGDDVVVGEFWEYSQDGKHLVRKGVGKSVEGKSKGFVEYFDHTDRKL
ncbi:MAG: hypothetical protein QM581_00600 [Pseudomonas sp.]